MIGENDKNEWWHDPSDSEAHHHKPLGLIKLS